MFSRREPGIVCCQILQKKTNNKNKQAAMYICVCGLAAVVIIWSKRFNPFWLFFMYSFFRGKSQFSPQHVCIWPLEIQHGWSWWIIFTIVRDPCTRKEYRYGCFYFHRPGRLFVWQNLATHYSWLTPTQCCKKYSDSVPE